MDAITSSFDDLYTLVTLKRLSMDNNVLNELAEEYSNIRLEQLCVMEEAIKKAKEIKASQKEQLVPPEEIEELRAAWKFAESKLSVEIPIKIVIAIKAEDSDPCAVYPAVQAPEYMQDWDAYELLCQLDEEYRKQVEAHVQDIQERLKKANEVYYRIQDKYDVPAYKLLKD